MTFLDARLTNAFNVLKPGIPLPAILQTTDPKPGPTRIRELLGLDTRPTYTGRFLPQVHAELAQASLPALQKSRALSHIYYDEPQYAFALPPPNPLKSTPEQIKNRVSERLAQTTPPPKPNPHYRSYLGFQGPTLIDMNSALFTIEDARTFTRAKEVYDAGHTGRGRLVAVLDTGIDATHPMLDGKVQDAVSFVAEPAGEDGAGHGCVTPDSYVVTSLCGPERIDRVFETAERLYGSSRSTVEGHSALTVTPTDEHTVAGLALDSPGRGKRKSTTSYHGAIGKAARLQAVHKIPYDGPLIRLSTRGHAWRLTPWHPVLLRGAKQNPKRHIWRYARADQVQPGDYLALPQDMSFDGPSEDPRMLYLLGFIIGDGHVTKPFPILDKRKNRTYLRRYVLLSRGGFLRPLLDELAYRYLVRKNGDLVISRRHLWDYAVGHGVPQGVKSHIVSLPKIVIWGENLWPFLAGYIDSDGSFDKDRNRLRIRTSSEQMAKQLSALLASKGMRARIDVQLDERVRSIVPGAKPTKSTGPSWCIKLSGDDVTSAYEKVRPFLIKRQPRVPLVKAAQYSGLRVKEVSTESYSGHLYDMSTETGNYLAGSTAFAIMHNTWCGAAIAGNYTEYHGKIKQLDGQAMQGMAADANLLDLRVLTSEGVGLTSGIIQAIEEAVLRGAHILNMSLGSLFGGTGHGPDAEAVNEAARRGVACCVAAGNSFGYLTVGSPGSAAGAITVGSVAMRVPRPGAVSHFSSKGPLVNGIVRPSIAAPGGQIAPDETILGPTAGTVATESGESYSCMRGTSMATPMVAGIIALMGDKWPRDRSVAEGALATGVQGRPVPYKNNRSGWGVIDAVNLQAALERPRSIPLRGALGFQGDRQRPALGFLATLGAKFQSRPEREADLLRIPLV